jgi:dTDP-4-amino-4,6-dideoxygalactose transaminase
MKVIQAPRASAILYWLLASLERKDPWLLPANICPVVPLTFTKARVPFEFADISKTTLHMDLDQAEARMSSRPFAGLLYAHTYGAPSTPDSFFSYARSLHPGMLIIDDRCLCTPEFDVSSTADVVLFSTGYAKIVDLNSGGYAFVRNEVHVEPETNVELPSWPDYRSRIEASLESSLAQRAALNEIYASRLPVEIQLPDEFQQWRFNIRVRNRSAVMQAIFDDGLFASAHYASLAGVVSEGCAPQAESLAGEVINLFNDHHFDVRRAERVCDVVRKHLS